ncbi:MAG: hypothetical protein JNL74_12165, partial [Fibrobacteres bacterium]|nr:hypothetical protein [Fibrobacterota bacterium]
LFGVGTAAFSWIPAYFTQAKIPEAIGNYNETIQRHQKISASTKSQKDKDL